MIVANEVGQGLGFEREDNQAVVITKNKQIELPLTHKTRLAGQIIAILASTLQNAPLLSLKKVHDDAASHSIKNSRRTNRG
jgi:phosphopantothenoylcysteine decarboxylase/phosphopantothenate--cysteine ligase